MRTLSIFFSEHFFKLFYAHTFYFFSWTLFKLLSVHTFFCNHFLNFCLSFLWRNSRSKYNLSYSFHRGSETGEIIRLLLVRKKNVFVFCCYVTNTTMLSVDTVCNFQSMKTVVELNSLLSKFFCDITWFVISPD